MNAAPAHPATPYQFYLVEVCGHSLFRGEGGGPYFLEANPERTEYTPGGIGHIPYADEEAAEAFEATFGPELGPEPEDPEVKWLRENNVTPTECGTCGDLYCRSRFDCSAR